MKRTNDPRTGLEYLSHEEVAPQYPIRYRSTKRRTSQLTRVANDLAQLDSVLTELKGTSLVVVGVYKLVEVPTC